MRPLVVITPTGARPSFHLLGTYIARQTYKGPVRWIVVDDCDPPTEMPEVPQNWSIEYIRPAHRWTRGSNTQRKNLRAALRGVRSDDRVTCWEDDEHYAPQWLEVLTSGLERFDLVGQALCRKYNVPRRRAKEFVHPSRSSLCCTGMKGAALVKFRDLCQLGPVILDVPLWREFRGLKTLVKGSYVTGIKGLPGRTGIDSGHKPHFGDQHDPSGDLLRRWIGTDAEAYLSMIPQRQRDDEIEQYVKAYRSQTYAMGPRRRESVRAILAKLGGGSLLDVGTGRGETLSFARALGMTAVGTEVVPYLLNDSVVYAQAHALPYADASFDHVTCFDVLEHLVEDDIRPALKEMLRVARSTVTVSASERSDIRNGRELHISKRSAEAWLRVVSECWPGARKIGLAGASHLFRAYK